MTDVLDDAAGDIAADADADVVAPVVIEESPSPQPASWAKRAGAFAVDVLLGAGVVIVFMLVMRSAPVFGWIWWISVLMAALVFFAIAANRVVLPVITGWSLGRSLFGIAVVRRDGRPIDPWFLLLRDLAHLLDTIPLLLGWFWPLVDSRRRTFADIVTRTEVRRIHGARPDLRPYLTKAVAALGGLALLGATLGYLGVYRHEKAVASARQQISEQGPKIVPDVLSYAPDTIDADFSKAQSLVTDSYRPQLIAQQDAVRKAKPIVANEYWVTNSAVLSGATDDHAQMLLLMQGQRGAEKQQRFITATVRASFVKSGSGQWQVSDLTVLAKPAPPQVAQPAPPQPGKPVSPQPGRPSASPEPSKPAPSSGAPGKPAPSSSVPSPSNVSPSNPSPSNPSPSNSSAANSPKQGR